MRRTVFFGALVTVFILVFLYFSFNQITPSEIENAPDWMPLNTALEQAKSPSSEKLVLVDVYEVGCRFCRRMEREVYPSESIRTLIDRGFHPVKVNGNSDGEIRFLDQTMTEREFASQMGVTAFPFTIVLDSDGNVVSSRRGYMGISDLSRFLNEALDEVQRS